MEDKDKLDVMVGMFYNSKCGYYATLQKLVDYYAQTKCGVSILDERLNTLRNGFEAVKERRQISWDGINFIIGGKK